MKKLLETIFGEEGSKKFVEAASQMTKEQKETMMCDIIDCVKDALIRADCKLKFTEDEDTDKMADGIIKHIEENIIEDA